MAKKRYFIKAGNWSSFSQSEEDLDLERFIDKILKWSNVTHDPTCCTKNPLSRPVRFNQTAGELQYLNTSNVWVAVP